jgi:hypothetical protein
MANVVKLRRNRKPASQAERDAIQFEAIKAKFNWTNEEWADQHLPWVRTAAVIVAGDRQKLRQMIVEMLKDGSLPEALEGFAQTKQHFEALCELLTAALARSFLVTEEFDYSPDNPPSSEPAVQS